MENPITALKEIIKDPVEFASITLPSAGLVVVLFAYKQHLHPELLHLPDPLSGNIYGALLFLVLTLVVSLALKRVSHDLLNWIYDRLYRDRKRKVADTWYKRVQEAAPSTNDPLFSKYQEALESLRTSGNRNVGKVRGKSSYGAKARPFAARRVLFLRVREKYIVFLKIAVRLDRAPKKLGLVR